MPNEDIKPLNSVGYGDSAPAVGEVAAGFGGAVNDRLPSASVVGATQPRQELNLGSSQSGIEGAGRREPVTIGCSSELARAALVECPQPDRRTTLKVRRLKLVVRWMYPPL